MDMAVSIPETEVWTKYRFAPMLRGYKMRIVILLGHTQKACLIPDLRSVCLTIPH
jgi:hypothetical protein